MSKQVLLSHASQASPNPNVHFWLTIWREIFLDAGRQQLEGVVGSSNRMVFLAQGLRTPLHQMMVAVKKLDKTRPRLIQATEPTDNIRCKYYKAFKALI